MSRNNGALPEDQQTRVVAMLNRCLADAIDLQLQSRQASWNVNGTTFLSLRKLFDQVAEEVAASANLIAERIVHLGGKAEGTVHVVARRSALDGHLPASASYRDVLATKLTNFARYIRYASAQATELSDSETAALLNQIARGIDTWLRFVETSPHG